MGEAEEGSAGELPKKRGWRSYWGLAVIGIIFAAMLTSRLRSNVARESRLAELKEEVAELELRLERERSDGRRMRAGAAGPRPPVFREVGAGLPVSPDGAPAARAGAGLSGGVVAEAGDKPELPPVELATDAAAMGAKYAGLRRLMEEAHERFGGGKIVAYGSDERREYDDLVEEFTLMATEMAMSMQHLKGLGDGDAGKHAEFLAGAMVDALGLGEADVHELHGALADGMERREAAKAEHSGDERARDAALEEIEGEIAGQIEALVGAEDWNRLIELFGEGMLNSVNFSMPVPPGNEEERERYRAQLEEMREQVEWGDGRGE